MGKLFILLSMMAVGLVGVGAAFFPNNSLFWLASTTRDYQYVRIILAIVLTIQLVTRPPRHVWFRIIAGTASVGVMVWTVQQSYAYQMQAMDTVVFFAAALAIFVAAVERRVASVNSTNRVLA